MAKKTKTPRKSPVKAEIISNVYFVDIGKTRMFARVIVIQPPRKMKCGYTKGVVSGYRHSSIEPEFERVFYHEEQVVYDDNPINGVLCVGDDLYHVNGGSEKPILHEERSFSGRKGHTLTDYIRELLEEK